jgi:hypothetical protein
VELVTALLTEFLAALDGPALASQFKLRFPVQSLFPLPEGFTTSAFLFLFRGRFPLLVDFPE